MAPMIDVGMSYDDHKEASQQKPMPEGDYRLKVVAVETHTSQAGNLVFDVRLQVVEHPEFNNRGVFDHVTFGQFSFQDFCNSIGYKWEGSAVCTEDMVGLVGWAHLIIDQFKNKNGEMQTNNKVQKYF